MLGVSPNAARFEINKSYRALAARYHPDKHQGNDLEDLAREKLTEINEAHRVLKDDRLRAAYDAARRGGARGAPPGGAGTSGRYSAAGPGPGRRRQVSSWSGLITLLLLIVAFPLLMRVVRSPQTLAVVGLLIALVWFGPRVVRWLKKK